MRICFMMAAVFALASAASAAERDRPTAIVGNNVFFEIAPNVFAWYAHLRQGSLAVKVGDAVKAGALIAKLGNTGPSEGPHLHFGLLDKPDPIAGRSLPFVFDSFTLDGAVDFDASKGDRLERSSGRRHVA